MPAGASLWGPAITGGIIGGANLGGTVLTNKRLIEEAHKNRRYQTAMTYAKYPLSVAGMKKAGLNPIAFSQSAGGNTPSGAQATGLQNPLLAATTGVLGAMQSLATTNNIKANTAKTVVDTIKPRVKGKVYKDFGDLYDKAKTVFNQALDLAQHPHSAKSHKELSTATNYLNPSSALNFANKMFRGKK